MSIAPIDPRTGPREQRPTATPAGRHRSPAPRHDSAREAPSLRLVRDTCVLTLRILRRWSRDPANVMQSVVMPVGLLLAMNIVLGDGIEQVTGRSALYGLIPLAAMVGAMTGALVGGIGLMRERATGLMARLWVLRMHRAAGALSRLLADAARILAITLIVLVVGAVLGFRFQQGLLGALMWLLIPVMFGVAFSAIVITVCLWTSNTFVPQATEVLVAILMFFSTGFVPLDQFPHWLQPAVEHQPLSYAVEAMKGLSLGGPVLEPTIATLLWSVGVLGLCCVPMAIGYRRSSMRG